MGNNAARLMYHLSGDVELRSPEHGFSGVAVCRSVPEEVSAQAKDEMAKKIAQKDSKKLKSGAAEENRSADGDLRAAFQIASNAKGVSGKDAAKVKSDNSISDYCNRLQPGELGILKRNDSKCPACRGAQQALRAPLCKYSRR